MTGGVLAFAVSKHPAAVNIRLIGVILLLTGVIGLWPRIGGASWLLLSRSRLRLYVDEVAPVQGVRVPFDDLLSATQRGRRTRGNVWSAQAGHEIPVRISCPPEVTSDDEASARSATH